MRAYFTVKWSNVEREREREIETRQSGKGVNANLRFNSKYTNVCGFMLRIGGVMFDVRINIHNALQRNVGGGGGEIVGTMRFDDN